jgi:hypothetical protein
MATPQDAGACPYCGKAEPYKAARDPDFIRCLYCGVMRPRRQLSATEAQRALESRYATTFSQTPILDCKGSEVWGGPSPEMVAMLRAHCSDLLAGGRALDVGAGLGDFVSCLSHLGTQASGIETFARSAAIGRQHGLDLRDGRFDAKTMNEQFGDEKFDLISSLESLYYLDLRDAIELVRSRLTLNGAFYVKSLVAGSPYYWWGAKIMDRGGSWMSCFYDPTTLLNILGREGFKIVAVRYAHMFAPLAARGWAIPQWLADRGEFLFKYVLPPDRIHIIARRAEN